MIPSIPHINKQSFESPGAEDSAGSKVFSMQEILDDCIYFNNGKTCFRGDTQLAIDGIEDGKAYALHKDGHLVEFDHYLTNDGHKKAYILPTLFDIGFKSFRSASDFGDFADDSTKRIQLYVLSQINGAKRNRALSENQKLKDGHRFRCLPMRIKDGQIFEVFKGSRVGMKIFSVQSPGDLNYNIFEVFKNNHPVPKEDGYYVFVFNYSYIRSNTGSGGGIVDDSAYQCFFAKVD